MLKETLTVCNKLGLHARASARLVKLASRFISYIYICIGDKRVAAKSIMGVMLLAANKGTVITFEIDGPDEADAMAALTAFITNKCDEEE